MTAPRLDTAMAEPYRGREEMVRDLRAEGLAGSTRVADAFRSVKLETLLPGPLRVLAYADSPIPSEPRFNGSLVESPRLAAILLSHLEPESGQHVAILGPRTAYIPSLIAAATDGAVSIAAEDAETRIAIARAGDADVFVGSEAEVAARAPFDRILVLGDAYEIRSTASQLRDMGFAISRGRGKDRSTLVRLLKSGSETAELRVSKVQTARGVLELGKLFAVEGILRNAWTGRVVTEHDAHFRQGVEETVRGGPLDGDASVAARAAVGAFHAAYVLQHVGALESAADLYRRSLTLFPSAEAYTFLGWTSSFRGDYEAAIDACKTAIAVDPAFGNPYNDIGAYLLEDGLAEPAIPWLKIATKAARYCCYFYAHCNLGRAYLLLGRQQAARRAFLEALKVNPDYAPAREYLRRLDGDLSYVA